METLFFSLVLLVVLWLLWRGVTWVLRVGRINNSRFEPLSPADLRLLEEAAAKLMEELRATADECVAKIEAAYARTSRMEQHHAGSVEGCETQNRDWITEDVSSAELARRVGLTTGEIELMRSLNCRRLEQKGDSTDSKVVSESRVVT